MATETQSSVTPPPVSSNTQDFSGSGDEIMDNFAEAPVPDDANLSDDGTPMGLGGEKAKQSEPASSTLESDMVNGTKQPGKDIPLAKAVRRGRRCKKAEASIGTRLAWRSLPARRFKICQANSTWCNAPVSRARPKDFGPRWRKSWPLLFCALSPGVQPVYGAGKSYLVVAGVAVAKRAPAPNGGGPPPLLCCPS